MGHSLGLVEIEEKVQKGGEGRWGLLFIINGVHGHCVVSWDDWSGISALAVSIGADPRHDMILLTRLSGTSLRGSSV